MYKLYHLAIIQLIKKDQKRGLIIGNLSHPKNGKIVELAVRQTINGDQIKNLEALANPESLNQFKNIKALYE